MLDKEVWRLCQRRPEVGFDLHWHWGSWAELLKNWQFAKDLPDLYIQRAKKGVVEDFKIDFVAMNKQLSA